MVLVVSPHNAVPVQIRLKEDGEDPVVIGKLVKRTLKELILFTNLDKAFNRTKYAAERRSRRIKVLSNSIPIDCFYSGGDPDIWNRYKYG